VVGPWLSSGVGHLSPSRHAPVRLQIHWDFWLQRHRDGADPPGLPCPGESRALHELQPAEFWRWYITLSEWIRTA
jgi:hypothetical protein